MNGAAKLVDIAFVVSICVIIGMALSFSILFFLYGHYKIKNIKNGHEDPNLRKQIIKRYKSIWNKPRVSKQSPIKENTYKGIGNEPSYMKTYSLIPVKIEEKNIENDSIFDNIMNDKKRSKGTNIFLNCFFGIIYAFLTVLLISAISFKASDQQFFFGNTTLMTIRTGSMEKVDESNTYIKENNLNNQIEQYSLIGINKVKSDEELKLFDIIAFKHEDIIVVHRIVRIYENTENGLTYYTTRGDANSGTAPWELTLTFKDIIGKYNGFQNYGLGITLLYMQSGIGLIAILSALCFLLTYNITESKIEKSYEQRALEISMELDEELNSVEIKECDPSAQES